MTNFAAIGYTLLAGSFVFISTILAFGCAIRRRHIAIAPRCTARPKNTIYNPNAIGSDCQNRGSPALGWIKWSMSLSFDTMLRGIPGTGTRKGGMEGALLKVNLDSIILIKFHDLCLKVCALTTFLAVFLILPLNWTSPSDPCDPSTTAHCLDLTDYEKTTLAHIRKLINDDDQHIRFRLYFIVLCAWVVNFYTMYLVGIEWRENVCLRRVFYLEADHHGNRKIELEETIGSMTSDDFDEESGAANGNDESQILDRAFNRDPWIPHPEQRDTVPNIELYSVLVHNLPSLPSEVMDSDNQDDIVRFSRRQSMDWQLCVATTFFDHIVPNQPGFSSSVAAVTILPTAPELARAWRKWYVAASALRRLRFIRKLIKNRRHYDIETSSEDDDNISAEISDVSKTSWSDGPHSPSGPTTNAYTNQTNTTAPHFPSRNDDEIGRYYQEVFGAMDDAEVEHQFFKALDYGPEQTAMYIRELAQGAAACCPHGCGEGRLLHADFQELLELEKEVVEAVHQANLVLLDAQKRAAEVNEECKFSDDAELINFEEGKVNNHAPFMHDQARQSSEIEMQQTHMRNLSSGSYGHFRKDSSMSGMENIGQLLPETLAVESNLLVKYNMKIDTGEIDNNNHSEKNGQKMKIETESSRSTPSMHQNIESSKPPLSMYQNNVTPSQPLPPRNISFLKDDRATPKPPPAPTNRHLNQRMSDQSMSNSVHSHHSQPASGTMTRSEMMSTIKESSASVSFPRLPVTQPLSSQQTNRFKSVNMATMSTMRSTKKVAPTVTLNAGGKFVLRQFDNTFEDDVLEESVSSANSPSIKSYNNTLSVFDDSSETSIRSLFPITTQGQSRRRLNSSASQSIVGPPSEQWLQYEKMRETEEKSYGPSPRKNSDDTDNGKDKHPLEKPFSGVWSLFSSYLQGVYSIIFNFVRDLFGFKTVVNNLARENTVAVVTFTSRQAAVAARHCLADGRGAQRWVADDSLPVPPLADAASCDLKTCRGCCRPVTASINKKQKMVRKYTSMTVLILLYIFYIFPINVATSFFNDHEDKLKELIPILKEMENNFLFSNILSGIVQGGLLTLFFSVAPQLFKMIANFGSNAHSVITAERCAMKYYWWFMVITAFSSNSILTATIDVFSEMRFDDNVFGVLTSIADAVPTKVSATWINWMILRTTMVLPVQYLLQVNTFMFYFFGWKCCARCVMGGGPGGQTPYRIYIDSGVVFMCNVALSFAAPLTAPCALIYFIVCVPLWRRNSIYLYRPKFDGGGIRWPFLADEIISSLLVGQILLSTMMSLKEAQGPAIMAGIPIVPTIMYRKIYRSRYYKAFCDAGLLQTSLLDGWDTTTPSSMEKREDFRRFLVDAHKAAYIPVCIASHTTSSLTAQPAVVVPRDGDVDASILDSMENTDNVNETKTTRFTPDFDQLGVSLRRITTNHVSRFEGLASTTDV